MKKRYYCLLFVGLSLCASMAGCKERKETEYKQQQSLEQGKDAVECDSNSFAFFISQLPVKETQEVRLYDGTVETHSFVSGVYDTDFGSNANEQCADAVIYLYAKYLWTQKRYDEIKFHFVSGFLAEYKKWAEGYRIVDNRRWVKNAQTDYSYTTFRKYLNKVFDFANTASLYEEMTGIADWKNQLQIGDIFITPGFPGHTAMVVDIRNDKDGNQEFRLAQGFMPAQQIEILKDWFSLKMCPCGLPTSRYLFYNNEKPIVKRWKNL